MRKVFNYSPATATQKALSTKSVMSSLASALVNQMLLARNATGVLASTMDYLLKDVRYLSIQQKYICPKTKNQLLKQFFQWFLEISN